VAGYSTYLDLFPLLFAGKTIISNGMRGEVERCVKALNAAHEGAKVAVVSSGDPGVYAMAGLLMELTEKPEYSSIRIEVVPGVTAATAAAAVFGAPLMNDFAVISLSNLMTPDEVILKRAKAVADSGMVCVLYNPASVKRKMLLKRVIAIFLESRGAEIPAGIAKNVSRPNETSEIVTLGDFPFTDVDMTTIVIIGDSTTRSVGGRLHTPRGYAPQTRGLK
jgi:precorrin-3B C17-methyltransferase